MSTRINRIGAVFVATLLGSGCGPSTDEPAAPDAVFDRESVPWVLSARVESAPNSVWTLTGTVRARHEIPLSFRIGGEIQARLVDAGARVEEGDVLFRLDPRDVTQQRLAAEATVASAQAEHENANRERDRLGDLLVKRLASEQDHDRAVTAARAAEQRLVAAEATLEQARNAILYADLVAPAAGVILDVDGQVGQVVSPSQVVARLAEDGPREIEVQVPEARRIDLPTEATARLANGAGPVNGPTNGSASAPTSAQVTLREIAGSADPLSRTWRARYRLPELPSEPGLGTTVTLSFETTREASGNIARVPLGAVLERGEGPLVWRIEEGRVESEPVELIGIVGEHAEIRTDLPSGTPVVALGAHLLLPGQAVRVLER